MSNKYTYAVGRRKTASAQIRLFEGAGNNTINKKEVTEYVNRTDLFEDLYSPFKICGVKDEFHFDVKVSGSGESSQIWAIRFWISRALAAKSETFKTLLKEAGYLTRDARKVERKKPGLHKARKAIQWSKR